jgi:hypothetical protein
MFVAVTFKIVKIVEQFSNRVKLLVDKHMALQKSWLLDTSGFRMCSIKILTVK